MRAGAVPVALHRLRVERRRDAEVLGDAVEQPAGHPQLVGHVERAERADLELPLAGHDLGVDARDAEAGVEARVEVRLDDVTAEHLVGADAAVVEALRRGEAAGGEAERAAVLEERVLLLDAEERLLAGELLGDRRAAARGCWWRAASCRCSSTSHITSTFVAAADRVRAREHRAAARSPSCSPGAWLVLEPSKPQIGSSVPSARILVFDRRRARRLGAVDPDVLGLVGHGSSPEVSGSSSGAVRRPGPTAER